MRPAIVALLLVAGAFAGDDGRETTVGMTAHINGLVLPGTEVEVKPVEDRKTALIVRIVAVAPHGTANRYDLSFYAVEPGSYDLRDYVRRKDGSPTSDLPNLKVTVTSVLPPGQILPHTPEPARSPFLGGYYLALLAAGAVWVAGLLAILFVGRRKAEAGSTAVARPVSTADRLRPLVERGAVGQLTLEERADLERALIVFWKKRLNLDGLKPGEAFGTLRGHAEAGPLLEQLETWLHRPGAGDGVDVAALLHPYRSIPADALDLRAGAVQ